MVRRLLDGWEAATGLWPEKLWLLGELDYICRRKYLFEFMFPWALERPEGLYR